MPVFSYRAVNLNGEVYSGQTEKSSRALAEESLRESGLRIIELKKTGLFKRSIAGFEFFKPTLKPDEASLFLSQSAFMLGAGLDMVHMLRLVRNQSPNKRLQKVLAETEEGVVKGQSFSGELKKHRIIPEIISGAAEAGERSGRLPEIFAKLSGLYETEAKIADEIKKAMIYPVIVCAAILTVIIISVIFVLPGYARIFYYAGGELPVPTRLLLNAGEFIRVYYLRLFYFFWHILLPHKLQADFHYHCSKIKLYTLNTVVLSFRQNDFFKTFTAGKSFCSYSYNSRRYFNSFNVFITREFF